VRPPKDGERLFCVINVDAVNFEIRKLRGTDFLDNRRLLSSAGPVEEKRAKENMTGRVLDVRIQSAKAPSGVVINAPPGTGKTVRLQSIAKSIRPETSGSGPDSCCA